MSALSKSLKRWGEWAASPWWLAGLLPLLMLILIAGTVAQKYVGLYVAVRTFFSAPFIWLYGYVPLPGGFLVLALLTLNLVAKFLFKSEWKRRRLGVILAHFGALLLLLHGLLTAATAQEGYIALTQGQPAREVSDYHKREVVVEKDGELIERVDAATLRPGNRAFKELSLYVNFTCRNCAISVRDPAQKEGAMAERIALAEAPLRKENETNTGGVVFATGASRYAIFEDGPALKLDGYEIRYRKAVRPLPFAVTLNSFTKETYPGTSNARAYASEVTVTDGALSFPARIEMNAPLRVHGTTLYQSSFMETDMGTLSVLAVVKNQGRWFAYAATTLMSLGLLLHLFLMLREKRK